MTDFSIPRRITTIALIPLLLLFVAAVNSKITGQIYPVDDGDKDWGCWIASGAMMQSWKLNKPISIDALLSDVGGDYRQLFDQNEGLKLTEMAAFVQKLNLTVEPLQCYTVQGFADLAGKGPLYFIYNPTGDINQKKVKHVVVVTAVSGDGSVEGTSVTYLDPAGGKEHTDPFKFFMTKYETGDAQELQFQIAHY